MPCMLYMRQEPIQRGQFRCPARQARRCRGPWSCSILKPSKMFDLPFGSCRYEWVFALKRDFPHLSFSLNGGVQSCQSGAAALQLAPLEGAALTGVMIGRAAYNAPWACLADADRAVFGQASNTASSRQQVLSPARIGRVALVQSLSKETPSRC